MTAAGLMGLMICELSLGGDVQSVRARSPFANGYKWLERNWGLDRTRNVSSVPYFLLSLERALLLAKIEKIGTHDWHYEGTRLIGGSQSGSVNSGSTLDVCMGVLFLTKAYVPVVRTRSAQDDD